MLPCMRDSSHKYCLLQRTFQQYPMLVQCKVTSMTQPPGSSGSKITLLTWLSLINWQHQLRTVSVNLGICQAPFKNRFEQVTRHGFFRERDLRLPWCQETPATVCNLVLYTMHKHIQGIYVTSDDISETELQGECQVNEMLFQDRVNNTTVDGLGDGFGCKWPFTICACVCTCARARVCVMLWQLWHSKKESAKDQTHFWRARTRLHSATLLRLQQGMTHHLKERGNNKMYCVDDRLSVIKVYVLMTVLTGLVFI